MKRSIDSARFPFATGYLPVVSVRTGETGKYLTLPYLRYLGDEGKGRRGDEDKKHGRRHRPPLALCSIPPFPLFSLSSPVSSDTRVGVIPKSASITYVTSFFLSLSVSVSPASGFRLPYPSILPPIHATNVFVRKMG